jgi:hypothetical protein
MSTTSTTQNIDIQLCCVLMNDFISSFNFICTTCSYTHECTAQIVKSIKQTNWQIDDVKYIQQYKKHAGSNKHPLLCDITNQSFTAFPTTRSNCSRLSLETYCRFSYYIYLFIVSGMISIITTVFIFLMPPHVSDTYISKCC